KVEWVEPVRLIPEAREALDFGVLSPGESCTRTFTIVQEFGDVPLEFLHVHHEVPGLHIENRPASSEAQRCITLAATFDSGEVSEPLAGAVDVFTTLHTQGLKIPVAALVAGDLTPNPRQVYFGRMRPGSTRLREVRVGSTGEGPPGLADIAVSSPELSVETSHEGGTAVVRLKCTAGQQVGKRTEYVTLTSNDGARTRIPVIMETLPN
ncbi:MAG: hypothetical protein GY851_03685, partial [bacterium]|nr:hypothetical protein [bacterium]